MTCLLVLVVVVVVAVVAIAVAVAVAIAGRRCCCVGQNFCCASDGAFWN